METTAQEIISKILSRFNMNSRDPNLFYITMESLNKTECASQPVKSLQNNNHPLEMQLHSGGNAKFTVQMRSGGVVKVYDNCLTSASFYKSMFISKYTTTYQLIQLLLNHYGVAEGPENFLLAVVDDNGKEVKELSKCDCPLQLQQSSSAKISFSLKRVMKQSNLSRPHSFHGVTEQRAKEHHLHSLRRSLRKKGKNIRFDFDQTDEEREEAIEQLRSNLHQLTNNKESVFYNVQRSPLNAKITLDKDDHKEFLRAKIENLKQRKLLESRRQSDQSVLEDLEALFENELIPPSRPHRTSRVEHNVNGLDKENYAGSPADEDSYPGKREAYLSSEDSSGVVTPVLKDDFEQRLNRENGEVESHWRRGSDEVLKNSDTSYEGETEKTLSNINVRHNSKNENRDSEAEGEGRAGLDDREISYSDDYKTPLVTPRTPFQTPRANLVSDNDPNALGVPNADPYGSPTPTASGRGSRISNTSDFQSVSFDSSGAPTPTPKMDEYSSVEKDTFAQAVKAKNTMTAIDEAREIEKTLQSSDTESEPGTPSKVKTVPKLQKSRSTEKDFTPRKSIASLPSVGTTPIHTPRIDSKKSKPKAGKTESKTSELDSESDTKSRSRSHSIRAQDPPNNTAKRKEVARGRIQNPDTPPQTPRSARSRTHSTETPFRTSSRTDDISRSRTQSRTDDAPSRSPRTQSRNDRGETVRSRTQSRADETPLRTPRTESRAEESADENMTPRPRSNSSQSARSDVESQSQRARKMPPARSNLRHKGSSFSDGESTASRKTIVKRVGADSRSEESLRKPVAKATVQRNVAREVKGSRAPAVRRPNVSGYSSDKTHEKVTPKKDVMKRESSSLDLEKSSLNKTPVTKKKSSGEETDGGKGDDNDRRRSSTKEFREIVTDRLYQLSRTPSTKRKNYKPVQVAEKKQVSSESQRSSGVSSVVNDSGSPETQTHNNPVTTPDSEEAKVKRSQTTHSHGHGNHKRNDTTENLQKTTASSGYSSDTFGNSSSVSMTSEEGLKSTADAANRLRKMNSLNSEDESIADGSVVSDADNTSAKESMTSDLEAQERENALQRRRRRRPRRSLPAIPNMAEVDLEERKKQLFSGAKQRLQRVFTESSYDSESSMNKSDIDSQSERGEGNASRASTLTGRDEDERLPLYLISASCPETEDTGDDQASIGSSAFESPKSDDEEIMNVISRGKQRTNFTAELVPPIQTNFSQPLGDSRSGSKVGTHTEEQIYRAKQNLLKGINVTFKNRPAPNARGYRTDAEEESGTGQSTARGYISDQGNRGSSGYVSDQSTLARTHVNAGNLGPLLVKGGANTAGLPRQLVPLDADQERLIAAKYQFFQHQLSSKTGSVHEEIQDPLTTPRIKKKLTNSQTQTDIRKPNFNRPSIQKVLQSCDLITLTIDRGRYLSYGIRLFEGVFQPLSSRHSLRSPRGKRPLIGQTKGAFSRVRPMANEDEIESIISVDRLGDRSAAKQDGRLQEGDYIVEVNGNNVMDGSLMEVQGALETSGTKLGLVIARTKVLNLAKEDIGLAPHTDLEKELEKLKLKYNNVLEESQQKDRLIEELRSVIVKKAQVRQVKDGVKNCKINVDLLECSAV
ncbi:serine/arginine repetitive matrix protein 2-like isoform X2 [Lineus longissimus]